MHRTTVLLFVIVFGLAAIGCNEPSAADHMLDSGEALRAQDARTASPAPVPHTTFGRVTEIFQASCLPCHSATPDHPKASAKLDLGDKSAAYAALINMKAQGSACSESETLLVVPGAPDDSLLLQKLVNAPGLCGNPMPKPGAMEAFVSIDEAEVAEVKDWISAGANDD